MLASWGVLLLSFCLVKFIGFIIVITVVKEVEKAVRD
jgi:hypothetical protein